MGNPGLLQELPDIAALLPEGGGDGEQLAAADCSLAGLDAPAVAWQTSDLALNHRLAQGTLSGVVGRLDSRNCWQAVLHADDIREMMRHREG